MPSDSCTASAADDLQTACRHLSVILHEARRETTHRADAAQHFISEIEMLRRFTLEPARLREELQQPCGEFPSLGSALVDCLFRWVPERRIPPKATKLKAPDKFWRRLYATIAFLLNVDFKFLYAAGQPPACQLVVSNEDQG